MPAAPPLPAEHVLDKRNGQRPLAGQGELEKERGKASLVREVLKAWDPVARKVVWEQVTADRNRGYDGGVLSTAGNIVVQGRGDGTLRVYNATTGAELAGFAYDLDLIKH